MEVGLNYSFSLPVRESNGRQVLIGSEIEPIKIGESENEWQVTEFYLAIQGGKPIVIAESYRPDTEWADGEAKGWEAYAMPSTMQIDRIKIQ